jgi:primosomal protein N'
VKRLQLKRPASAPALRKPGWIVEVALRTPVAHLDNEFSYFLDLDLGESVNLGSIVRIPFAGGKTFGFVTGKRGYDENRDKTSKLKFVEKKIGSYEWFNPRALERFRRIAESYGVSLFTILNLAIPNNAVKTVKLSENEFEKNRIDPRHLRYLRSIYGTEWEKEDKSILQVGPGVLWERIAASLILSDPSRTLVLVPTESHIDLLQRALELAQIQGLAIYSSTRGAEQLTITYQSALAQKLRCLVGVRSAALLPFNPERIIILEPFDKNYLERRAPYYRADDALLLEETKTIFLVHAPSIQNIASGIKTFKDKEVFERNRARVFSLSEDDLVSTLRREINQGKTTILLSVNDKNFSSALICNFCKNRAHCSCGFPFVQLNRSGAPFCSKCNKFEEPFLCKYCASTQLSAVRSGAKKWESILGSNIKKTRIILSNSLAPKREILCSSESEPLIAIATRSMEPRILLEDGSYRGYDVVFILGALQSINNYNFRDVDEFRNRAAAIRALLRVKSGAVGNTYIDLPVDHAEFKALANGDYSLFLQSEIEERQKFNLPPYSVIAEIKGSEDVLVRLREFLSKDKIFLSASSRIYEISGRDHECRMMLQVAREDRVTLLALLAKLLKLRSSRSLPLFKYRLDPDSL